MKKHRITALALALLAALAFASCDVINNFIASRTRNIAVIQVFNSSHEETRYFLPNDTLYVQVAGLTASAFYQVDCVDPDGAVITTMTAQADEEGVIAPSPLWYDVGFKKVYNATLGRTVAYLPTSTELGLNAFNIRVRDAETASRTTTGSTDFKLPFFVVYNTNISRPKPIIMAGRMVGGNFVVENDFKAGDADYKLYVQAANLTSLPTPAPASGKVMIYVVPFDAGYYQDGDSIANYVVRQEATIDELTAGVQITANSENWGGAGNPAGESWAASIPAFAKGKAFSVIVDVNGDGVYQEKKEGTTDYYLDGIDGNGVAGFIVEADPPSPPPVKYISANIASGGVTWGHHWYDAWPTYDYRDNFKKDGSGTQYGYDWQYGGYGVKALWNPYIRYSGQYQDPNSASLYYGTYVDVYIVATSDMTAAVYAGTDPLLPTTGTRKMTMPVQYACTNGANMQTIWRASYSSPMTVGSYVVVVDVNRDGKLSDKDIVDNLHNDQDGTTAHPSTDGVGFNVVN